jgi:hypothetical protein
MTASTADPAFFTGSIWLMASGSWQVRFEVTGAAGAETASVPVPAIAISTLKMQRGLGLTLAALGLFLVVSMAGIVAASVREARLEPGAVASPSRRRRAVFVIAASLIFMALLLWAGAKWWNVEAASYSLAVFHPITVDPTLSGNQLDLNVLACEPAPTTTSSPTTAISCTSTLSARPEMDAAFHLHPILAGPGDFRISLPVMPPGRYALYGDVVHANGFPETLVTKITIPADMQGNPLGEENAAAHPQPLTQGQLGSSYKLPDNYVMVWDRPSTITANTAYAFRFRLLDPDGNPAPDMQPYLGMAGHAAFVKTDGTVFAHTHPEGSAAMASLILANGRDPSTSDDMDVSKPDMNKMNMSIHNEPISSTVEFPLAAIGSSSK